MVEPARSMSRTGLLRVWGRSQPGQGGVFGKVSGEGVSGKRFGAVSVVQFSLYKVALHQMNALVTDHTFVAESARLKGALWDILFV